MLERGSFDFRVIGESGGRGEICEGSDGAESGDGGVKTPLETAMLTGR